MQVQIHNNLLNDYADTSVRDPGQSPPPRSNAPPLSNDPSCRWQSEHVQCVVMLLLIPIFVEKKTHRKNNIWYGNELSEYDTVQSTALVDGPQYLTVVRRLIAVSIGGIRLW